MSALTWAGSQIWSGLSSLARLGQRAGAVTPERLDTRVISVGNIQAGGTGKTPLVARVAREAAERGLSAVILLRGYGGRWEKAGGTLLPGEEPADPRACGDEAALLQRLAPDAVIGVGADRAARYREARRRAGKAFDLAILDDGFQNVRVAKDLEIVAITSTRFGESFFREHPAALERADLLVWTKGETLPESRGRPLVKARYRLPPPEQEGGRIWLVTGVGDPHAALESFRGAGYEVIRHFPREDHARYEKRWVEELVRSARAEGCRLATTGKDGVKWRAMGIPAQDALMLEPELVFEKGQAEWERIVWG
ncbi:MAG: tetraacyldisaccharide 4'-kinase [Oligoflexia bacterium]|nr:tetraacyldisaccharide 4'-kinase [Oligoflexia bacterium]